MKGKLGDWSRRWVVVWSVLAVAACGGEDPLGPDAALEPFVGDWKATSLVLTNIANPSVAPDLVELGATFTINIQPSGAYTAILIFQEQSQTEIGQVSVSGSNITLQREFPSPETTAGVYEFSDADHLTIDGDTEFDFNLDGTPEPALVHFELERQ